jgi:hypothetical protein
MLSRYEVALPLTRSVSLPHARYDRTYALNPESRQRTQSHSRLSPSFQSPPESQSRGTLAGTFPTQPNPRSSPFHFFLHGTAPPPPLSGPDAALPSRGCSSAPSIAGPARPNPHPVRPASSGEVWTATGLLDRRRHRRPLRPSTTSGEVSTATGRTAWTSPGSRRQDLTSRDPDHHGAPQKKVLFSTLSHLLRSQPTISSICCKISSAPMCWLIGKS